MPCRLNGALPQPPAHPWHVSRVEMPVAARATARPSRLVKFGIHRPTRVHRRTIPRFQCLSLKRGYYDIISQPQRAPFGRSNACFRCGSFECVRPFPSVALGLCSEVRIVVGIHATHYRSHGVALSLPGTHIQMGWRHEGMGKCLRQFTGHVHTKQCRTCLRVIQVCRRCMAVISIGQNWQAQVVCVY